MAGRKPDPEAPYRVTVHKTGGYRYAATVATVVGKTGKRLRRYVHWGRLTDDDRFLPNMRYVTAPPSELVRLRFPESWDMSDAEAIFAPDAPVGAEPAPPTEYENRSYGSVWLLLRLADERGVTEDLLVVFRQNSRIVNDLLSIAIYPYLIGQALSRLERWQSLMWFPADEALTPSKITRLTQSITHEQVMEFFKLRISRQPEGAFYACDSTTRSAWGSNIAEISYGRNKDNKELDCTLEVVVYSLTRNEPVYYRTFPGNMPDTRTVRTIAKDLASLGIRDFATIYDRGYESKANIDAFLANDMPFVMCAKVAQEPVVSRLVEVRWDESGLPEGAEWEWDEEEGLYCAQFPVEGWAYADDEGVAHVADPSRLVCNCYLDVSKRARQLVDVRNGIAEELASLEAQRADGTLAGRRSTVNRSLRYHTVSFGTGEGGETVVTGIAQNERKVRKARATCGFFSSLSYDAPGGARELLRVYRTRDEQEKYFQQMKDQMGFDTQDCSTDDGKAGRMFAMFVGLILSSVARAKWRGAPAELRKEFKTTLDLLDEMRNIRLCGYPDGSTHVTSFLAPHVRICDAFGVEVPPECLSQTERIRRGIAAS